MRDWSRLALLAFLAVFLDSTACRIRPTFLYADAPAQGPQGSGAHAPATASRIEGTWSGEATNSLTKRDAALELELSQSGTSLSGHVTIEPPLRGSGEVRGQVYGEELRLRSKGVGHDAFVIDWYGSVDNGALEGTYTVINTRPAQHGRWRAKRDLAEPPR